MSTRNRSEITLEFADNRLLAALSGPHEKHFARLEQKLGVRIEMRGNLVAITGPARERAKRLAHHGPADTQFLREMHLAR